MARALFPYLICFLFLFLYQNVAGATPVNMGVLYPDVPEPYQNVFLNVIAGIEGQTHTHVQQYVLENDVDIPKVQGWLNEKKIGYIIALGRRGLNAAIQATDKIPITTGALLLTPGDEKANVTGISLAPDPKALFGRLLFLVPNVKQVYVVYDPNQNDWMIKLAQQAAADLDIKLLAYKAESLREAVYHYNEILHMVDPKKDALWLPIDTTTVNDQVVLPLILREAWDIDLVVFSSNPAHASKGALFSAFPDNEALGRRLATMASRSDAGDDAPHAAIHALEDLKFAINRRTADHLGLGFSAERQQKFDFEFPAR
jgi:putative ABC transport system substrate-binding protein